MSIIKFSLVSMCFLAMFGLLYIESKKQNNINYALIMKEHCSEYKSVADKRHCAGWVALSNANINGRD